MSSNKKFNLEYYLNKVNLSVAQGKFYNKINKNKITFATGPSGTSKTFTACYSALKLLSEGTARKIILTKPIRESGEKLGYLPGEIESKVLPYMESFMMCIEDIVGKEFVQTLLDEDTIEFKPLAYMRGTTRKNSILILDEAQNCNFYQLMLYVTRLGYKSKMIILGDISQYDVSKRLVKLPDFIEMLEGIKDIGFHIFAREDIVREKILIEITDRYERWKEDDTAD